MKLNHIKKPVCIVGLGKSGTSARNFLIAAGFKSDEIVTFDQKDPSAKLSQWIDLDSLPVGTLVVSPGVPLQSSDIQKLVQKGWLVTSEINLATSVLTDEIVIGITGSVGKSTVTSLLGQAAMYDDKNAFVGGNLGTPFCEYALNILNKKEKARYVILELSSYQLENAADLKLYYSAITYLAPNHLERYANLDEYYLTKCDIGRITEKLCVINSSSEDLIKYKKKISGTVVQTILANKNISLIGKHNLENFLVAEKLAEASGMSSSAINAMSEFKGLAHRLETLGTFGDILFINDSKATAMDSVLVAVQAALTKTTNKLHLLLGGKDKNLPWEQLSILKNESQIIFYFFGQCGALAREKSQISGDVFENLDKACEKIFLNAKPKDVVLLSPGGTSLDQFKNFEERGNYFRSLVLKNYSSK